MSKKIVVKLDMHDNKDKQKALKAVSALIGIDAISMDMASQRMTVIGMVDPVNVVSRLRKASWAAIIDSVGPAKEPEKKEEEKKDAGEGGKKDGEGEKKDGDAAKKEGEGEKKDGEAAKKDGEGEKKADDEAAKKDVEGEKKADDEAAKKAAPPTKQQLIAELMN